MAPTNAMQNVLAAACGGGDGGSGSGGGGGGSSRLRQLANRHWPDGAIEEKGVMSNPERTNNTHINNR